MGVPDDGRLLRLPKHLPQEHRFYPLAADQIGKHVARAHGGQLIRIAHQNQTGSGPQRPQQRGKQGQVHHGHLVHNDGVRLQRFLLIFQEGHLMGRFAPVHAQKPMNRLSLHAGQFAHAFRRTTCGSRQYDVQSHLLKQGHNAPHRGGFTGTGTTGEDQHPVLRRQTYRLPLLGRKGDPLFRFNFFQSAIRQRTPVSLHGQKMVHPHAGGKLSLPQPVEIAGLHIGHLFLYHCVAVNQVVQRLLHQFIAALQQLAGGGHQFISGQEDMPVILVMTQFKGHRRLQPFLAVQRKSHAHGDLVRDGELHAADIVGQQIGIVLHHSQRCVAVLLAQLHGKNRRQLILSQKGHQPPQSHMLAEALRDLLCLLGRNALDQA